MTNENNEGGGTREYAPFAGNFVFEVEFEDKTKLIGSFQEVSGLSTQIEVEELIEGGTNGYVHKLPGRVTWPNVVLKRGVTKSDALFEWFATASDNGITRSAGTDGTPPPSPPSPVGKLTRATATVFLRDAAGRNVRIWNLKEAFPVRWTGPTLAGSATDVAVEELEIAHHGFGSSP